MCKQIKISFLEDEKWWGGRSFDGHMMPFQTGYKADLRISSPNQAMPLLISNKGRYLWSEYPFRIQINEDNLQIDYRYGEIEMADGFCTMSAAYEEACKKHFPTDKKMPGLLNFTSPQYNTWIEMHYEPSQEKVLSYAREVLENGFKPGVLMIDDNWMKDYGNWEFNPAFFPNPKAMMEELHGMGFKVMLWVCPYVSADGYLYRTLNEKGYLLKDINKKAIVKEWWNGYSCILDMSNKAAIKWFEDKLKNLVRNYGVDGFKFDAGDPIMFDEEHLKDRYNWTEKIFPNEDCEVYAKIGLNFEYSELREAWKCAGKALLQRQQDKAHSWDGEGLKMIIPNGLAQGLMGYAYNCPDMVGGGMDSCFYDGEFKIDQELFVRYCQASVLFPIVQFSMAPWMALDKEHLEYCKEAVKIRERLTDYIVGLAKQAAQTGLPIMRSMEFVFPNQGYDGIVDQFMLGDKILVAPVLNKGQKTREVVLPEGIWQSDDGATYEGGRKVVIDSPISRIPWFKK